MKIGVAQMFSQKGDIEANLNNHLKFIESAIPFAPDLIIFPELSLTNYEPDLAKELAIQLDDRRLDVLQHRADQNHLTIGVGVPLEDGAGTAIAMIIFQPRKPRAVYAKKYLHPDEEQFFIRGTSRLNTLPLEQTIGLAICYELSIPAHAELAHQNGADIYFASVAKTATGVEKSIPRLAEIAKQFSMIVCMANCVGECEGAEAGGRSSIFDRTGTVVAQLDGTNEGILIYDTVTGSVAVSYPKAS